MAMSPPMEIHEAFDLELNRDDDHRGDRPWRHEHHDRHGLGEEEGEEEGGRGV